MRLAIIPARGGSKRIPRKNIKEFCGQPMIAYAINAAAKSNLFDEIIVSTDDDEIESISKEFGANIYFKRPSNLANDFTPTVPVIKHAISYFGEEHAYNEVCCIYPCSPFIDLLDLRTGLEIMSKHDNKYIFPIAEHPSPIHRALEFVGTNEISPIFQNNTQTRTQDLGGAYYDAGQFYWGHASSWLQELDIHQNALGIRIPKWRAIDIDTNDDWELAEAFYSFQSRYLT